jgi:hypothetical protein
LSFASYTLITAERDEKLSETKFFIAKIMIFCGENLDIPLQLELSYVDRFLWSRWFLCDSPMLLWAYKGGYILLRKFGIRCAMQTVPPTASAINVHPCKTESYHLSCVVAQPV